MSGLNQRVRDANPIPDPHHGLPPETSESILATVRATVALDEPAPARPSRRRSRRRSGVEVRWAAVTAVLLVAVAGLLARQPGPSNLTVGGTADSLQLANRYVEARNQHDGDAARLLVTDRAAIVELPPTRGSHDLPDLFGYLRLIDEQWSATACVLDPAERDTTRCPYTMTNRLFERDSQPPAEGELIVRAEGGRIAELTVVLSGDDATRYQDDIVDPWLDTFLNSRLPPNDINRTEWTDEGLTVHPGFDSEARVLMAGQLARYLERRAPSRELGLAAEALHRRLVLDGSSLTQSLSPDATITEAVDGLSADSYDAHLQWLAAIGWQATPRDCGPAEAHTVAEAAAASGAATFECTITYSTVWTRTLGWGPADGRLTITVGEDGEVVSVAYGPDNEVDRAAFDQWFAWLQANHPGDVEAMYGTSFDDGRPPAEAWASVRLTPDSVDLFDRHSDDFAAG